MEGETLGLGPLGFGSGTGEVLIDGAVISPNPSDLFTFQVGEHREYVIVFVPFAWVERCQIQCGLSHWHVTLWPLRLHRVNLAAIEPPPVVMGRWNSIACSAQRCRGCSRRRSELGQG